MKQESGQVGWTWGLFSILFLAVFLCAALQLERYRVTALYLEDALAASNLAAAVIDIEAYGSTHDIIIADFEMAYEGYKCAVRGNLNLNENWEGSPGGVIQGPVQVENFTIYNVCGDMVEMEGIDEAGVKSYGQGRLGQVYSPNGKLIESTSVYSEITFMVESFPGVRVKAHKGNLVDVVGEGM